MFLKRGSLPWQGLDGKDKADKYDRILDMKMDVPVEQLCKSDPKEFAAYLKHCRSLGYEDSPKYTFLAKCWRDLYSRTTSLAKPDWRFDWPSAAASKDAEKDDSSQIDGTGVKRAAESLQQPRDSK